MAAKERERRQKAHLRAVAREARRGKKQLRRRIVQYALIVFGGLGGLAIVLSLVLPSSLTPTGSTTSSSSGAGLQVAIQGDDHILVGQEHPDYNTTPPTSGWHYAEPDAPVPWGIYQEPIPNEVQVHNLEHGEIMVQYNCPEGCPDLVQQLEQVVNSYPEGVTLAPYPDMSTTIALTAWGWIDTFEEFSEVRVEKFIQDHIDRGPESFRQGG